MPRRERVVLPEVAHHVTQRSVEHSSVFVTDADRRTYLRLLHGNLQPAGVRLLAWCLMTNHVHLVLVPETAGSLAALMRRVHGRYAQYFNARAGRCGHLWQNRFFGCAMDETHLWRALRYVERNPVRAGLVRCAEEYLWSSARAHMLGEDEGGLLDMAWWRANGPNGAQWAKELRVEEDTADLREVRECTYAGRPLGEDRFVREVAESYGRHWARGRPRKAAAVYAGAGQGTLFEDDDVA